MRLSGQDLYRLILRQPSGYTVILDTPGPAEKIPVGTCQTGEVWLRQGAAEAFYDGPLPLTVGADACVSLAIGGPLTNSVMAEWSGDALILGGLRCWDWPSAAIGSRACSVISWTGSAR